MAKEPAIIKPRQEKGKKYLLVRYSKMNVLGFFEHNEAYVPKVPTRVVIKTERGLELGHLTGQFVSSRTGQFRLNIGLIKEYFENCEIDFPSKPLGKVIRYATAEDLSEEKHLMKIADEELKSSNRFVQELALPMKIIDAEHIFGGERIIFYFTADSRVDFRELVKKLAHEYQTRIEMCQIGSRDEAKILGDAESCGQQCCCQRFLKVLKPVSMRMAKIQKATLDPSKISGYCGRLKCCLRYEDETYTEFKKRLPKNGSRVKTAYGEGKVVDSQILTQIVLIELDKGEKIAVGADELEIISSPAVVEEQEKDISIDDAAGEDFADNNLENRDEINNQEENNES